MSAARCNHLLSLSLDLDIHGVRFLSTDQSHKSSGNRGRKARIVFKQHTLCLLFFLLDT